MSSILSFTRVEWLNFTNETLSFPYAIYKYLASHDNRKNIFCVVVVMIYIKSSYPRSWQASSDELCFLGILRRMFSHHVSRRAWRRVCRWGINISWRRIFLGKKSFPPAWHMLPFVPLFMWYKYLITQKPWHEIFITEKLMFFLSFLSLSSSTSYKIYHGKTSTHTGWSLPVIWNSCIRHCSTRASHN